MLFHHRASSPITKAFRWDTRASLLVGIYSGAIYPFIGRIARGDLNCSEVQLSLIAAAPFIGNLLSPVWAGQMEGKSKMPFAVWSWALARGIFFLMFFVTTPWFFVAIVSASALLMSIALPAYAAIMKDAYPDQMRGRLMSYIRMSLQGAILISTLFIGRLLDILSYQYIFPLAALFGIAAAWAFNQLPRSRYDKLITTQPRNGFGKAILDTLSILKNDQRYRWFSIAVFIYGFGNLFVQPVYILFQVDRLSITNTQVANMANLQSITALVAFYYWGRYLDRRGPVVAVLMSILVAAGINVVYLLAYRVEHLYFAAVISGITNAGIELAYINATLAFSERRLIPKYQSVHSLLLGLRGTIAPFVGPLLMGWIGMKGTFGVSLIMILMGAAMLYYLPVKTSESSAHRL